MTNLRDVLCEIFFGGAEEYKNYIVPLQGNWYNPTQKDKVDNWIGYVIDTTKSSDSVVVEGKLLYRNCQTSIHLAFIGKDAEEMAQSVLFWIVRTDVQKLIDDKYKGVVNNKEIEIYSAYYEQEGLNSTLCWNVDFSLQHNIVLNTESPVLTKADLSGNIVIGG